MSVINSLHHTGALALPWHRMHVTGLEAADVRLLRNALQQRPTNAFVGRVTFDLLPNDVLLEIFDFYMDQARKNGEIEAWHTLVHVCQKWRNVVFESPRRLNTRLVCTARKPVRQMLAVWPPLPIVVKQHGRPKSRWGVDNIVAALEHNDRIREIDLWRVPGSLLEKVLVKMKEPFPALTFLDLQCEDDTTSAVVPDSFMGGSTPRLQNLSLRSIPVTLPGLQKLLSSATHLVNLSLVKIPNFGYISPEAMVSALSTLTRLEEFWLEFQSPPLHRHVPTLPPPTRTVLPALADLRFKGVSEYLEDLVARIDVPQLHSLGITFFYQLLFDIPQLTQFVCRTPKFKGPDEAYLTFSYSNVSVILQNRFGTKLALGISCRKIDWQLLSLVQICTSSSPLFSIMEHLYIDIAGFSSLPRWEDDVENGQWLDLLRPFTVVKNVYFSRKIASHIVAALQELVEENVTSVLPGLECLFMEMLGPSRPVQEAIGQFVAARQLANRPIAVSHWGRSVGFGSDTSLALPSSYLTFP